MTKKTARPADSSRDLSFLHKKLPDYEKLGGEPKLSLFGIFPHTKNQKLPPLKFKPDVYSSPSDKQRAPAERTGRYKIEIGRVYGQLTPKEKINSPSGPIYVCICRCGNVVQKRPGPLADGENPCCDSKTCVFRDAMPVDVEDVSPTKELTWAESTAGTAVHVEVPITNGGTAHVPLDLEFVDEPEAAEE